MRHFWPIWIATNVVGFTLGWAGTRLYLWRRDRARQ